MTTAHYSCMVFPQADGTFTMNVTIATGFAQSWTSPETPIAGATMDEARANALAETRALRKACERPGDG